MSYTGCTHADWLTGGWTEYYTSNTTQPTIPIHNILPTQHTQPTQPTQPTQITHFIKLKSYKVSTLTTLRLNN